MFDESKFIPENICPECYRELPNHGPDCSLNKTPEVNASDNTVNEQEESTENNSEIIDIDEQQREKGYENKNNQEKINEMKAKIKEFFALANGEMMRLETANRLEAENLEKKLKELYTLYKNPKIEISLQKVRDEKETFRSGALSMHSTYMFAEEGMVSNFDKLDIDKLTPEEIELIEQSNNKTFETVKENEVNLQNKINAIKNNTAVVQQMLDKIKGIIR